MNDEKCFICYTSSNPSMSLESLKVIWEKGSDPYLGSHLTAIFVLRKVLDFTQEEVMELMKVMGGINPGEWFRLCGPCSHLVLQTLELHKNILLLLKKFGKWRELAQEKLRESMDTNEIEDGGNAIIGASEIIRRIYRDTALTKQCEQKITIPEQEEQCRDLLGSEIVDLVEKSFQTLEAGLISEAEDEEIKDTDPYDPLRMDDDNVSVTSDNLWLRSEPGFSLEPSISLTGSVEDEDETSSSSSSDESSDSSEEEETPVRRIDIPNVNVLRRSEFKCSKCSCSFHSHASLRVHTIVNHELQADTTVDTTNAESGSVTKIAAVSATSKTTKPVMQCVICKVWFRKMNELADHLENHQKSTISCSICKYPALTEYALKVHITKKHPETKTITIKSKELPDPMFLDKIKTVKYVPSFSSLPKNKCHICKCYFAGKLILRLHTVMTHHLKLDINKTMSSDTTGQSSSNSDEGGLRCAVCKILQKDMMSLVLHLEQHYKYQFSCPICKLPFETNFTMRRHLFKEHEKAETRDYRSSNLETYVCERCNYITKNNSHKNNHVVKHILEDSVLTSESVTGEEFTCKVCNAIFDSLRSANAHVKEEHSEQLGIPKYKCSNCEKTYSCPDNLREHVKKAHTRGAMFCCDKCGVCFSQKYQLKCHHESFHSEKTADPHICDVCGKTCSSKKGLITHKRRLHDKPRSIKQIKRLKQLSCKCSYCDFQSSNSKYVQTHMKEAHPELYIYQCLFCPQKCIKFFSLMAHQRRLHPNETASK